MGAGEDRKSTRLNSSHTVIYTLSLHDALPSCTFRPRAAPADAPIVILEPRRPPPARRGGADDGRRRRSEEHTSELQSHRDLHSFPTRRSSELHLSAEGGPG